MSYNVAREETTADEKIRPGANMLTIVGPTASGKSHLAIELARRLGGEIVSADSRYIYRGMDIGTAKPSPAERSLVPHHLIDVVEPDQSYSVADYVAEAVAAIESIHRRGRLPLLVGGTGLYVRAVTRGYRIPTGTPNQSFREKLERRARDAGSAALHAELDQLDPAAAASIDPRNVRRVIRAIEVCVSTGQPFSAQQGVMPPAWNTLTVGLTRPREELYRRIDERYDAMVEAGWLDEVACLLDQGYDESLPSMTSLGYREIARHLRGELPLEEGLRRVKFHGHRYARQQYTWFRLDDRTIHWFQSGASLVDDVEDMVRKWLETSGA